MDRRLNQSRAAQILNLIRTTQGEVKGGFLRFMDDTEKAELNQLRYEVPAHVSTVDVIRRIAEGRI